MYKRNNHVAGSSQFWYNYRVMISYDEFAAKFGIQLNEQQAQAVQSTDDAVLLLAVPGSGKTTTLVTRLGYLIYCLDAAPESILTMTYTVAASADMRSRFISLFGGEYAGRLEFRTINGVCASVINMYLRMTGSAGFSLLDNNAKLLTEVYQKVRGEYPDDSEIKELQKDVTYIKNMRLTREKLEAMELEGSPVAPVYDGYCAAMRTRGLMDYDDQLVFARTILIKYPAILDRLRNRFRYICVDEAQDTSKIQHEIIRMLAGSDGNLFMVGDEDQSIYGFRAAYPDALMSFTRDHERASVLLLEQNYRSVPEIVTMADRFIARNTARHEKHMFTRRAPGGQVRRIELGDRAAQYAYICRMAENDTEKETAVLFRNNDSAVPLIDWLDRRGIRFRCRQSENVFFSNRTVNGVRDILTLALDPLNEDSFMRVYYRFGLSVTKAAAEAAVSMCREGRSVSLISALARAPGQPDWLVDRLSELEDHFAALRTDTARDALNRIRYKMGYGGYVLRSYGDTERLFLLSALAAHEKDSASLLARLDALRTLTETGGDPGSRLILSTIHSSKGLEYGRVVLIDAIDGLLPSVSMPDRASADKAELAEFEEERRLFYVAVTRARDELMIMTYANQPESQFVTQFFERPRPERASAAPVRASGFGKITGPAPGTQRASAVNIAFYPGQEVVHAAFGRGRVTAVGGELITISFPRLGSKSFSLSACILKGLIQPAE